MTRLLLLGTALAWFAACDHVVNNVGTQRCIATTQPCATDSDCGTSDHVCDVAQALCVHCPEGHSPDEPDAGVPPVDAPDTDASQGGEECVDPLLWPCSTTQDCAPFAGTTCDVQAMRCVCPPAPPPPPTGCTTPVDNMGNPVSCFPQLIGCEAYPDTVCDAQTYTCVCP